MPPVTASAEPRPSRSSEDAGRAAGGRTIDWRAPRTAPRTRAAQAISEPFPHPPPVVSRLIAGLLALGVALIPIDGVQGPAALGELGTLLCFPAFALAVGLSIYALSFSGWRSIQGSIGAGALFLGAILISALANLPEIQDAAFHNRTGINKLGTSLLVIAYGFCLAAAFERQPLQAMARRVVAAVAVSAVACLIFGIPEYAAKHGAPNALYSALNAYVHSTDTELNAWDGSLNLKMLYGWDPRLRTLSFEPPAFGNFTGFAWPWLVYGAMIARRWKRVGYVTLTLLFTVLIIVSEARTGWLMLAANVAIALVLRTVYLNRSSHPAFALARIGIPLFCLAAAAVFVIRLALDYHELVGKVVSGDSVSDLSRSASQIAAYRMFFAHPLLGLGLGQYAFHGLDYMPSFGFLSNEIWPSYTFPNAPWPAAYSMFARLAAETGLVGLASWILLWSTLFIQFVAAQVRYGSKSPTVSVLGCPLAMNAAGVLVSGLATDTFKTPMIWVSLGLGFAFLRATRAPR